MTCPSPALEGTPTGSTGPVSSSSTPTHVHQATSAQVVQEGDSALRSGPVVMPRPPARSAGRYSPDNTKESRLPSRRNNSEPPFPSGAVRAVSCGFTPKSDTAATRTTVVSDSRRAPEDGRSQKGTLQTQSAEDWCSQMGTLQTHIIGQSVHHDSQDTCCHVVQVSASGSRLNRRLT